MHIRNLVESLGKWHRRRRQSQVRTGGFSVTEQLGYLVTNLVKTAPYFGRQMNVTKIRLCYCITVIRTKIANHQMEVAI